MHFVHAGTATFLQKEVIQRPDTNGSDWWQIKQLLHCVNIQDIKYPKTYWGMKTAWIIHPLAKMETLISNYFAMPILQNQKSRQEMMCIYTNTHITRKLTYF